MNANRFAATLDDGYGRPAPIEMIRALGLDEDEPRAPVFAVRPPGFRVGLWSELSPGGAANTNADGPSRNTALL